MSRRNATQRERFSDTPLTCLSAFSGLGGMDLGLEAAGFDVRGCVEWDELALRSLKANRGGRWNLLEPGDIEAVAKSLQPEDLSLSLGDLDLLAGAPPCQPYSKAGQWVAGARQGLADRRGQYLDDYLSLIERFLPKVALIENVTGFVSGRTSALPHIAARLERIDATTGVSYRIECKVCDAADHGVPQRRRRAFVVLTRVNGDLSWPAVTRTTTAWDAIGGLEADEDVPIARGKWAELLPSIPEGENYLWHTSRGGGEPLFGYRTRYWSFLLKLAKSRPSWTLPAQPGPSTGPFHWNNRPLTIQEMLRLQSFPADWIVEGGCWLDRVKQVGNATPPLLSEAVGRSIAAHIDDVTVSQDALELEMALRRPIPEGEPVAAVPRSFRYLAGEHPDHPGAGQGPGRKAQVTSV